RRLPLATSRAAWRLVLADAFPAPGARSFTPDRRAFDRPIAMACFGDLAPCLPSRMWCISSRTNSPAWVDSDLPCAASLCARSMVSFSGMDHHLRPEGTHSVESEQGSGEGRAAGGIKMHLRLSSDARFRFVAADAVPPDPVARAGVAAAGSGTSG